MNKTQKLYRVVNIFHNKYTAWIVLAISIFITISASWLSYYYSSKMAEERFTLKALEITDAIQFRMKYYEQALWGGVGLFNSKKEISRVDFEKYVASLALADRLPGLQGIGFSVILQSEKKKEHIDQIRSEGFPEYDIKPLGDRDTYSAIIYLEPFDWRNKRAFGYDMWSNDMRRAAMSRARSTGLAATSGIITLVQETDKDLQRGFLMYLPVYQSEDSLATKNERTEALVGWVYSPFRAGNLMKGILSEEEMEYEIELYDNELSEESLLFDSNEICHLKEIRHDPQRAEVINLEVQGRRWKLYLHTKPSVLARYEEDLPVYIGVFGLVVDLVLFVVIFSLYKLQIRTKRLSEDLEVQKNNLEVANEDLGRFAYLASHDLQEPLRTVSSYSALIREEYYDKLDDEGQFFLEVIDKATRRMKQLINDILDYSRLGTQNSKLEHVKCNLALRGIVDDLGSLISENQAEIRFDILPEVYANKTMIKQLFLNLISNAIKYRSDKAPIIEVKGYSDESHFFFEISDNGMGIEEKYQEKIFEVFKRLHSKTNYSGTGIGLSLCKRIVELHGGNIGVESKKGDGSTFTFTISRELTAVLI
ncbi:MAG: CHASE domain-containing protein [Reichenbachiella sp.]|uniref:sensor histidine kinase n=1 Tax=Reichenbachiella sp. TaxID=2184521 RepID=UPI003262E48E